MIQIKRGKILKAITEYPTQDEMKAFNKGWGRSLACVLHFLRHHSEINLDNGDKEKLISYMEKNRNRQFKSIDKHKKR